MTSAQRDRPPLPQGDLRLLHEPTSQHLLQAALPARIAYLGTDGAPRIVASWFQWTGAELVMATYVAGPAAGIRHPAHRLSALRADPRVAISIDADDFPPSVLTLRGAVTIEEVDGIAPEYAAAARRYLGASAARTLLTAVERPGTRQARIVLRPAWVGLLDFATRLPSAQGGVGPSTLGTASQTGDRRERGRR